MSLKKEHEAKAEVVEKVKVWLSSYKMPTTVYGVISALVSLGYLSGKARRATDEDLESVGTLICDECQHPRNVADYILEPCPKCGDKEHVIQWLT